jgi:hypothetical protein
MTDRELLEAAAKAAGITGDWCRWHQAYGDEWVEGIDIGGRFLWNPLLDDGDAFRLAVKLQMRVLPPEDEFGSDRASVRLPGRLNLVDAYDECPYAATRRAITLAAAMIGESK